MNNTKFMSYNVVRPRDSDIPKIAEYIMTNNIKKLPRNLRLNYKLVEELMHRKYGYLFDLNFDEHVYSNFSLDDFVTYATSVDNTYESYKLPSFLVDNSDFITQVLQKKLSTNSAFPFDISNMSADTYSQIDKTLFAQLIDSGLLDFKIPYFHDDFELLQVLVDSEASFNFNSFSDEVLSKYGYDKIARYIGEYSLSSFANQIPKVIFRNRELLSILFNSSADYLRGNILSFDEISRDDKFYLLSTFDTSYVSKDLVQEFADYVIEQHITSLPGFKIKKDILPILLKKKYEHFWDIYHDEYNILSKLNVDQQQMIIDLYFDSDYKGEIHSVLEWMLFTSEKSLDKISKIGDYIINNNITNIAGWLCDSSPELFDYLYKRGYDHLLSVCFDRDVLDNIPIEKLQAFYKEHLKFPNAYWSDSIKCIQIMGLDISNIEYDRGKYLLLYDERLKHEIDMIAYNGFSLVLCNRLKTYSVDQVYTDLSIQLKNIERIMKMSEDDLKQLFIRYQQDPVNVETEIIELVRVFCSKYKEYIAQQNLEKNLHHILVNYTIQDQDQLINSAKLSKRKDMYIQYVADMFFNNVPEYATGRIAFLEQLRTLGLDNLGDPASIILNIVYGKEVIDEPKSYNDYKKQRALLRLRSNYERPLSNIVRENEDYRGQIIEYINGNMAYDELRKIIDTKALKTLLEIRNIYLESGAELLEHNGAIYFHTEHELTKEEMAENAVYEKQMKAIDRLRRYINKDMNKVYPLDNIELNKLDVEVYGNFEMHEHACLDFSKMDDVGYIVELLAARDEYADSKCTDAFNKLFIDTGIIYGVPFVSTKLRYNLFQIASQMPRLLEYYDVGDFNLDNLDKIVKRAENLEYLLPYREALLGEDIIAEIVNGDTFITDVSMDGKKKRVEDGCKYISLAGRNVQSTIPYTRVETDNFVAERYRPDDPEILTTGIKTDACFRLYGNDNDFLLYSMFNKNGIVVRLGDKDGKFIGRMSGFRNGNVVYFNQLRTIYDTHGSPTKKSIDSIKLVRECVEKYAQDLVESTRGSDDPIEHVVILKAYGYSDCDYLPIIDGRMISNYPMSAKTEDYKTFKSDSELSFRDNINGGFTTDYLSDYPALSLASLDDQDFRIDSHDVKAIYDRPRRKPIVLEKGKIDETVLAQINFMNAKNIYWGNNALREKKKAVFKLLMSTENINYAVIGDDFYIVVDNLGNVLELCLPYDDRAKEEFEKYRNIVLQEHEHNGGKAR